MWALDVPPAWILGTLLALTYATVFKVLLPDQTRGFVICAGTALVGFFAGNALAASWGITTLRLGELNLLGSSFGSLLALTIVNQLRS